MIDAETLIRKTLELEGGYVNDPADRGGETKYGISKRSYPNEDIANLTLDRAIELAKRDYYDALRLDEIRDDGVRWKIFDMAFHMGRRRATRIVQGCVGETQDGIMGEKTIAAVNAANAEELVKALSDAQARFYKQIVERDATQKRFLAGWLRRAQEQLT